MALSTEVSSIQFVGDGVTLGPFATGFKFLADAHLVVKVKLTGGIDVTKTLGVDYTVTGAGLDAGGGVTFLVAPAFASIITIERTLPFTQPISLPAQGPYTTKVHETEFDRLVMQLQQLVRRVAAVESQSNLGNAVAGNGLVNVAGTWGVGAGAGIQANADDVAVLYGAAGAMLQVTKAAANAGVANTAARGDHKHDIATAAPGSLTRADDVFTEGGATTVARSDHRHQFTAPGAPANVTAAAAAVGGSAAFALSDHKHDITVAAPVTIGVANAAGAAASVPRSDHVHAHGAQTDGAMHALAIAGGANGFLSGADKTKLDNLPTPFSASVQTNNGTLTTLATITPADQANTVIEVTVTADRSTLLEGAGYKLIGTFRKKDGVVTLVGAVTRVHEAESAAAWDCVFTASAGDILVQVTGAVGSSIRWLAFGQYITQAG